MENTTDEKLVNIVDEITQLEINKAQLLYAKFQNTLVKSYEASIKQIENDFIAKASLYGKKETDCVAVKNDIISKYDEEFQKIYDSRRLQFINIQNEIQEMCANKLIVIANFKQIIANKIAFIKSNGYTDYLNKKQKFKEIVDTTLVHDEFDKYTKLLEDLKDPLEIYQNKLVALAAKYDNYDATIKECEKKLEECVESSLGDFEEICRFVEKSLVANKKENFLSKLLSKIFNKIGSNAKFEKNVVQKMQNELVEIDKDITESVDVIEEQTIDLIATIEEIRDAINLEFNSVVE